MNLSLHNNTNHHSNIRFQNRPVMPNSGQFQGRQQPYVQENKRYEIVENHNSLFPQLLEGEKECSLCQTEYDLLKCVPMMVCRNQHNCCLQCAKQILNRKNECPFCRVQISVNEVKKNRILANIIENYAQKRGKMLQTNPSPEEQLFNYINGGYYEREINRVDRRIHSINLYQPSQPYQYPAPISGYARLPAQPQIAANRLQQLSQIQQPALHTRNQQQSAQGNNFCECCRQMWTCIMKLDCWIIDTNGSWFQFLIYITMGSVVFFICDLCFGFLLEQQKCMDEIYSHNFSLRSWLKISGIVTLLMCLALFFSTEMLDYRCRCFERLVANVILILWILKILGWNVFGIILFNNIPQQQKMECSQDVTNYMTTLQLIYFLCACVLGLMIEASGRSR